MALLKTKISPRTMVPPANNFARAQSMSATKMKFRCTLDWRGGGGRIRRGEDHIPRDEREVWNARGDISVKAEIRFLDLSRQLVLSPKPP